MTLFFKQNISTELLHQSFLTYSPINCEIYQNNLLKSEIAFHFSNMCSRMCSSVMKTNICIYKTHIPIPFGQKNYLHDSRFCTPIFLTNPLSWHTFSSPVSFTGRLAGFQKPFQAPRTSWKISAIRSRSAHCRKVLKSSRMSNILPNFTR